jgi:Ser/Thr protein kinase RdoA (MazF antagonist)
MTVAMAPGHLWQSVSWPRPAAVVRLDSGVAAELLKRFGQEPAREARPVQLARGSNSASWQVRNAAGERMVLRCALGNCELSALESMAAIARRVALAGVATKLALSSSESSRSTVVDEHNRPWQCWTWLRGRRPVGSEVEALAMGRALRCFHEAVADWSAPAHRPYWSARVDPDEVLSAVEGLGISEIAGVSASEIVGRAVDVTSAGIEADCSVGHGDCHVDNFLMLAPGLTAALFDFELVGRRPAGRSTDLGVLMHRFARIAAQGAYGDERLRLQVAYRAAAALARAYGAPPSVMKEALTYAIRESLAKIAGCASSGPPGLDLGGCRTIALNHCLYLAELVNLDEPAYT